MASQGPCGEKYVIKNTFIHLDDDDRCSDGYSTPPRRASKAKPPLSCPPAVLGALSDSTRSTLEDPGSPVMDSAIDMIFKQTKMTNSPLGIQFSSGVEFLTTCAAASPGTPVNSKPAQVGLQQTPPPVSPLRYQGALPGMKDTVAPTQAVQAPVQPALVQAPVQVPQAPTMDWNAANSMAFAHAMQLGFSSYAATLAANSVMPITPSASNFGLHMPPATMPMAGSANFAPSMAAGALPFIPGSPGYIGSPSTRAPGAGFVGSPNLRAPVPGAGYGSPSARTPPQLPSPGMNTFKLQLRKVDGGRMGLNASIDSSGFLKVASIDENSAMGSYNKQVKGSSKPSVRSGDIILSVNSFASPKDMLQQLQEKMFVSLEVAQSA